MMQSLIERLNVSAIPDPTGQYIPYRDYAAHEWRNDVPDRPDSPMRQWKIIAEYPDGKHQFVWYYNGAFFNEAGKNQKTPVRWAYLRPKPEFWHQVWRQWVLPGTVTPPPVVTPAPGKPGVHIDAVAGQQMIDILKRSFTTAQLQDFIDASPYDEPDTGAPETPGAMG